MSDQQPSRNAAPRRALWNDPEVKKRIALCEDQLRDVKNQLREEERKNRILEKQIHELESSGR